MNAEKFTTNFQVFIDQDGKVHCARCRSTGKFINREVAQSEYEKEFTYTYDASLLARIWAMLVCFVTGLVIVSCEVKQPVESNQDSLEVQACNAYQGNDFKVLSDTLRKRFESKYLIGGIYQ